jgi:hypothetical protein
MRVRDQDLLQFYPKDFNLRHDPVQVAAGVDDSRPVRPFTLQDSGILLKRRDRYYRYFHISVSGQ